MIMKSMRKKMLSILIVYLIIGSMLIFSEKVSAYTGCITVHPNPIDIFTHNLTGTRTIFFWSNESMEEVNVTVCNSQTESYTNEEIYQDKISEDFLGDLVNATYNKTILINNCSMFDVHIWGDQDCPDIDLGIFLDGKDGNPEDEVAQKGELVEYCADADADEEVRIMEPVDGLYIIKVLGYTVTGYPGHFDMDVVTMFIQPGIFAVQDIPSGSLPPYALGAFNLTWNLPETSKDDIYLGALYIGTQSAPKNILVPIKLLLDRVPPKISDIFPHRDSTVDDPRQHISASFQALYSDLDQSSVEIYVDNVNVTPWAKINVPFVDPDGRYGPLGYGYWFGSIVYVPMIPLENGLHTVEVRIRNVADNLNLTKWNFTVEAEAPPHSPLGGMLRVALQNDLDINPLTAVNDPSWNVIPLMYDSLARTDPHTLEVIPWVAMDWMVDVANNKTITVDIRDNIKWHDGSIVTADDIVYSYGSNGLKSSVKYGSALTGINVTKVDTDTVIFTLNNPDGLFFSNILTMPLIPVGFTVTSDENGCGPFKFDVTNEGTYVRITAFKEYFNGRPKVDFINFTFYQTTNDAAIALINGNIDFIGWTLGFYELTEQRWVGYWTTLMGEPSISIYKSPGLSFLYLGYNTAKSPLEDSFFRQVIAKCLDKDTFVYREAGTIIADSVVTTGNFPYYNDSVPKYKVGRMVDEVGRPTTDLRPVNLILDRLGYFDRDGDGWREVPDGTPFNFVLLSPQVEDEPRKAAIANSICDLMRRVGINTTLELNSSANRTAKIIADDFDLYLEVQDVDFDPKFMYDLFHSSQIESGENYANYDNFAFDTLIEKANGEMNMSMRQQLMKDCAGWIAEELPYAPLLHYKAIEVCNKRCFTDWVDMLGGINNFWSFVNVHILTDTIPPKVSSTIPIHTEINVPLTTNIEIIFNDTMNTTSVEEAFSYTDGTGMWDKNNGAIDWSDTYVTNDTMAFNPTLDLRSNTTYTAILNGSIAKDLSGNLLDGNGDGIGGDNYVWEFTTKDLLPPQVYYTSPSNEESNVSVSANIIIIFDESMNTTSVENAFSFTDGTGIWDKDNGTMSWSDTYVTNDTITFNPTEDLKSYITYNVTIDGNMAKDLVGNLLDGNGDGIGGDNYVWEFTTQDILPPHISSTCPLNGEIDVLTNTNITVIFDEGMNIISVENAFTFTDNMTIWNKSNGTFSWSDNNKTMSFNPTNKLAYNTTYYVIIGATAKDTAGNYLDGNKDGIEGDYYTWSFLTEIGTGTINGTVKDRNGNPVSNATITVYYANDTVADITATDENGDYIFNIAPGLYDIKIEKSGYEIQWERGVEVTADEITTANIAITPTFHLEGFWWLILPIVMIIIAIIIVVALKVKKKKPSNEIEEKAKEEELEKAEDEKKRTENNNE